MNRLIDEALIACKRWGDRHADSPPPVVRVTLINKETWYFNGLSVAPTLEDHSAAVVSSAGLGGSTLVVGDPDIFLIEIEPLGAEPRLPSDVV